MLQEQGADTSYEVDAFSRLRLSSAAESPENCAACGNSKKRYSLSPSFQEPAKRAALHHPEPQPIAAANENPLIGFTRLPLPTPIPDASPLPIRRTISEPIPSPVSANAQVLKPQSPVILRTTSDPNPVSNSYTPPRPPAAKKNLGESPNSKRLKRMKQRLQEINNWWNHVMSDDDEEDEQQQQQEEKENVHKDVPETASEEAVFVEKNGECLVLHFKCPCGNGYQILLNGNYCYYKLTNF